MVHKVSPCYIYNIFNSTQSDWLWAPYFLNYFESKLFYRDAPFIEKKVSFVKTRNFFLFIQNWWRIPLMSLMKNTPCPILLIAHLSLFDIQLKLIVNFCWHQIIGCSFGRLKTSRVDYMWPTNSSGVSSKENLCVTGLRVMDNVHPTITQVSDKLLCCKGKKVLKLILCCSAD